MCLKEAVEICDDVVSIMAVDQAFSAVVYEPTGDVCAMLPLLPVVLLPAPDGHTKSGL